ncbi:MAG: hypothetical protein GYA20_06350 [Chloroflexi bacterium]|nr:hypothetical protein [Chloroflexota bacterium]
MPDKSSKQIGPSSGDLFTNLALRTRLFLRLMRDPRVNLLLKAIPFAGVLYLLFPLDIPTPIDDAAVLWVGVNIFVELCPPEVVAEHEQALNGIVSGNKHAAAEDDPGEDNVIEGEFYDVTDNPESKEKR